MEGESRVLLSKEEITYKTDPMLVPLAEILVDIRDILFSNLALMSKFMDFLSEEVKEEEEGGQ